MLPRRAPLFLLAFLAACGSPTAADYPSPSGNYIVAATFTGLPQDVNKAGGGIYLVASAPGKLGGSIQVTIHLNGLDIECQGSLVGTITTHGAIKFWTGGAEPGPDSWVFTGTVGDPNLSGTHSFGFMGSTYPGAWTATPAPTP